MKHLISPADRPRPAGKLFRLGAIVLVAFFSLLHSAQARQPATAADIKSLIAQLASDDPQLREQAVDDLMGLKRSDLPTLKSVALAESPLLPVQIARLRQVVFQVYLAGEKYVINSEEPQYPFGFLGVQFSPADRLPHSDGVHFTDRLPGFPAYRYLRAGDIIVKFIDWPAVPLRDPDDCMKAVGSAQAGDIIRLGVIRFGRLITVSIPLDFRPAFIPTAAVPPGAAEDKYETAFDTWIQDRQNRAEKYWNQEFSAIDPSINPGAAQASTSAAP